MLLNKTTNKSSLLSVHTITEDQCVSTLPSGKWENESLSQIPYKVLRGHREGVTCCQFCMNDKYILSASKDGNTQIWNASTNEIIHTYGSHTSPITKCRISPDNTKIISSSWDKTVCLFDIESGDVLWRGEHDGIVMSCDLSPDGKYAVSCSDFDNVIKIWDFRTGDVIEELVDYYTTTPTCCVFSPNSQRIASTSMDRTTKVWDMTSKKTTITLSGHTNVVSSCCFSDNERYLCTTSWDKTLQVWDISTGMFRSKGALHFDKGHEGSVSCAKFSQSAQNIISGGYDCSVIVWDVNSKSAKVNLKKIIPTYKDCLVVVKAKLPLHIDFEGHQGWVNGVDMSRDGKSILSCSNDGTIRVWNIVAVDQIPAVIENRRAMGLKIIKCEKCSKPFSIAQIEDPAETGFCVFCRLADPERNKLPYI